MNLITWNIQWGRGCDGRVSLARIVHACREMADFDVLCFQEVARNHPGLSGNSGEDQFDTLAALLPDYTLIKSVGMEVIAPQGNWREFGNAIITRLPILQAFRHLLPWPPDPGVPSMQRAATELVLETRAGPLRVTTTHLEYYSPKQRAAQVERLRDLQAEAAGHAGDRDHKENGPFSPMPRPASAVLTADFNFRPDDPLYARIQAPIEPGIPAYRDSWVIRHGARPHDPTLGLYDKQQWPGEPFCCDFVFVTEDLAPRVEEVVVNGVTDSSDHQPVLLRLRDRP